LEVCHQRCLSGRRNKEYQYILIKRTIQQEDIIILNIYALNIGVLKFIKHKETERSRYNISVKSQHPSPIDRRSKQKVNKDILELSNSMDKMDLMDYRVFHLIVTDYTFSH
jgi:hypothetical protein